MGCREAVFVDERTIDFPIFFSNHAAGHPESP